MSEEEFVEAIFQRDLKIKKLNEKIKELENKYSDEEIRNTVIKRCDEVIKKDYVSKDKIKAKIEEWDVNIKWANADDHYYVIKILKELLKGE